MGQLGHLAITKMEQPMFLFIQMYAWYADLPSTLQFCLLGNLNLNLFIGFFYRHL